MRNKLLLFVGSLLFVALFGCIKTSAATYTFHMSNGVNDSGYSLNTPTDLYMSGDFIVSAYKDSNNQLYVIVNHGYDTSFYGTSSSNSRRDVHFVGYSVQRMYYYASQYNFTSLGNGLYSVAVYTNAKVTGATSSSAPFFNNLPFIFLLIASA